MSTTHPILLAGPTAVGKSEIALHLAQQLNGEIISVDSMQVYRGLNIGTAKPTPAERKLVPHHLIDVVDLDQPFDAAQFVRLAKAACAEIQQRDRTPIFCGGTGLYFQAYIEGVGNAPPSDPTLRAELEKTPIPELLAEIERRDPVLFQQIDRDNRRRLVRALEVLRLTGKPFSQQRTLWSRRRPIDAPVNPPAQLFFGLRRLPNDLRMRIERRVENMFEQGLVAETQRLLQKGLANNQTAMQAIGYRQVVEYRQGVRSLEETIELIKIRTRQFAKRQMTWFRRQSDIQWLTIAPEESVDATISRIDKIREEHTKSLRTKSSDLRS